MFKFIFLFAICIYAVAPAQSDRQRLFTPALITPYPNHGGPNELVAALPVVCTCGQRPFRVILQKPIGKFGRPTVLYDVKPTEVRNPPDYEGLINQLLEIIVGNRLINKPTAKVILDKLGTVFNA